MNHRFLQILVIIDAALLAGCMASVIKTTDISNYYQVKTVSGSPLYRQHVQIFVKSEGGNFEYLGSVRDSGWAEKFPFGLSGLRAKNVAISGDGRSIIYEHNAVLAGRKSQKTGGLYRHEYGVGDAMLLKWGEYSIAATSYPKPLPPDIIAISRSGTNQAVSVDGEIFPLLLVGGTELHQAAFDGDTQVSSRLVREDRNIINTHTYWEMTPLEVAVLNGKEEAAKRLLMLGASYRKNGDSLIYIASMYKRRNVVDELLQRKTPFNYVRADGNTPFHATLRFWSISSVYPGRRDNNEETIRTIDTYLKYGADINMRDGKGRTLLHIASVSANNTPIAEYLVNKGIDIDSGDSKGNTALHYAVGGIGERKKELWESGKLSLLKLIVPRMKNIDVKNNQGISPLQRAVQVNNVRTAEFLIAHGADASGEFIHGRFGPKIAGQSIQDRIDWIKEGKWWNYFDVK